MTWTFERLYAEFGEDVLRDVVRDVNDLMCGMAGKGSKVNRIGLPEPIWMKLLARGGYNADGIAKAIAGTELGQRDAVGPFNPYTIYSIVNVVDANGGPITLEELDVLLTAALRYRQLIP